MTEATKSLLKNTILGFLGGGAFSAVHSLVGNDDAQHGGEFGANEITVPLSRYNFLKSVRPERLARDGMGKGRKPKADSGKAKPEKGGGKPSKAPAAPTEEELAAMSPKDVAALKRALISKNAAYKLNHYKIKNYQTTVSSETPVRNVSGAGSTFCRDKKGRFAAEPGISKSAWAGSGVLDDAYDTIVDNVGLIGGGMAGVVLVKKISDRIVLNKKKRQVEAARQRYVDTLNREVNDVDAPYYQKKAEQDRSFTGTMLGYTGLAGLLSSTTAAIVMYKIMEKRRLEEEREKDKDLKRYPAEKTIRYRFPTEAEIRRPGVKEGSTRGFFA